LKKKVKEKSSAVSKNQTQAHIFPTPPSSCSSPQNGSDIDGDDDWSEIIIPENYLCQENLISNNQRFFFIIYLFIYLFIYF